MASFVLIHGAFHGGWSWYKGVTRLEARGHQVFAPDLPGHGRALDSEKPPTLTQYIDFVVKVLKDCDEPAVLAGHSMGGMVITGAAEALPKKVAKLVYVTACLPDNGQSMMGL